MNYEEELGQKIFFNPKSLSIDNQIVLSKQSVKKRKLWTWLIVIGAFLLQMFPYAIVQNLMPTLSSVLFITWIGNSALLANLVLSVGLITAALIAPFIANWLAKSKNFKLIMVLGISFASIGFMLLGIGSIITNNGLNDSNSAIASTVIILFVLSIISQIGTIIFSTLGINHLISWWFPQSKKGTILGIVFMGGAIGNIVITPIVKDLLSNQFSTTPYGIFILFGLISLIIGLFVCLFIIKKPIPIYEYSNTQIAYKNKKEIIEVKENNSVSPLRASKLIWYKLFVIGFFFLAAGVGTVITQAQQTVTNGLLELNDGFNRENSLNVLTIMTITYGIGCLLGNFFGGFLNDKIGIKASFSIGITLELIAAFAMLFAPIAPNQLPYVWGLTSGLGIYVFTSSSQYMCGYLFGVKEQTKHLGIVSTPYFLGFGSFLLFNGLIAGTTGLNADNTSWLNVHNFLGHEVSGMWPIVWILCIVTLLIGFGLIIKSLSVMKKMGIEELQDYEKTNFKKTIFWKYGFSLWFTRKVLILFYKNPWESKYWQHILNRAEHKNQKMFYQELLDYQTKNKNKKLMSNLVKEYKKINKFQNKINKLENYEISRKVALFYESLSVKKLTKLTIKLNSINADKLSNIKKFYLQEHINQKIFEYTNLKDKKINEHQEKIDFYKKKIDGLEYEFNLSKMKEENDFEKFKELYWEPKSFLNNLLKSQIEAEKQFKSQHKHIIK